jgi:hypothetical protein
MFSWCEFENLASEQCVVAAKKGGDDFVDVIYGFVDYSL